MGITQEHIDRLYERFYRCDKGRSKELGGTGLGLSIVKHIAMAHGGSASVEIQPGQVSIFSITIPETKICTFWPSFDFICEITLHDRINK